MRLTALALLLALGTAPLAAQRPALGIEVGYSRASFTGQDAKGVKLHEGAIAGAYLSMLLAHGFSFRPGILLATKGGSTSVVADTGDAVIDFDLELVYIDIPLVLRGRIPTIGQLRLILSGGVVPGFRIGCATDFSRGDVPATRAPCAQAAGLRTLDVGILGGVGIGIPIEKSELGIEARLSRGLRSITNDADVKNQAFTLTLTIPF